MQLSPSTFPIDSNLLAVLAPGGMPGAAPAVPPTAGASAAVSFAELLPEGAPAVADPAAGVEVSPVAIDTPLAGTRPDVPVLTGEPMPFARFVKATPDVSPEAPDATTTGKEEEPSGPGPGATEGKDKAPKTPTPLKRQGAAARMEPEKKAAVPAPIFPGELAVPVTNLSQVQVAEEPEVGDAETPGDTKTSQPQSSTPARAEISVRIKMPGAPAIVARFAPAIETEATPVPVAEDAPAAVSNEEPQVPQEAFAGEPRSSVSPTIQAPDRSPVWAQPSTPARAELSVRIKMPAAPAVVAKFASATETEATPVPVAEDASTAVSPGKPQVPQGAFNGKPQSSLPPTSQAPERSPVWALRSAMALQPVAPAEIANPTSRAPQAADFGKPESNLPLTSQAPEHSSVRTLRSLISSQPIVATEPAVTTQPVSISSTPKETGLPSPAVAASTPLSAEAIEATVAPALELNLPPLVEVERPVADSREDRENFAELTDEFSMNVAPVDRSARKNFVSAELEGLTPRSKTVGIAIAKTAATMPPRFSFTPTPHPAFEYASVAVAASGERAAFVAETPAPAQIAAPQEVSSAHHAVDAVLRAVDHVATREQHSVNLHFSVGETDLKVRVELRADEVRTTFSTDSAELRSALSHEWQAMADSDTSGSARIAPATFTSDQGSTTFSGDASSRDRQQHQQAAHQAQNEFAQGRAGFGRPASSANSDTRPEVRSAPLFVHAGSRHLSTLA